MNERLEFDVSDAHQLDHHAQVEEDRDVFVKMNSSWSSEELRRLASDVAAVFKQLRGAPRF